MKSDGIRRSVRSAHRERAEGDAPDLGRVARIPGTGLPKGSRRSRKTRETRRRSRAKLHRNRVLAAWSLLVGTVAVGCLGLAIWLGLGYRTHTSELAAISPQLTDAGAADRRPRPTSLSQAQALAFVKDALTIRDVASFSVHFRPGRVAPEAGVQFLREMESKEGKIGRYEWLGSLDQNGLFIDGVLVAFHGEGRPRNRLAALVPDTDGKWKIDFEAFARTVDPSWNRIAEGRGGGATVRVDVVQDTYFNGPFADDRKWLCVGITSPDTDQALTGYCTVGSPQEASMKWILARDTGPQRAVLEIRNREGAEPRQVEITRVIAEGWVTGERPFDQGFR